MTESEFEIDVFEGAVALVARRLAFFRTEDFDLPPTEDEKLTAGHIVGGLYANGYIKRPSHNAALGNGGGFLVTS